MIANKFVDLYARNSGMRDQLVAERDVVLTYALHALYETGVMDQLAIKGGTCLRTLVFGSSGRFSEDLDFTLDTDRPDDDVLTELVEVLNGNHHGITFTFDEYYKLTTTPPSAATFATDTTGIPPAASASRSACASDPRCQSSRCHCNHRATSTTWSSYTDSQHHGWPKVRQTESRR